MIMTKTPLRISFVGGGTDLPWFYSKHGGAVISTTIDKFVTVKIKRSEDDRIICSDNIKKPPYAIIRQVKMLMGIGRPVEICIDSDIAPGSGLGGSSALTVGLLSALHVFKNVGAKPEDFARMACEVEIERLGKPIGKQDQYTVAYGGLRKYTFRRDGGVAINTYKAEKELTSHLMLFRTNIPRGADSAIFEKLDTEKLKKMKALVPLFVHALSYRDYKTIGGLLHQNWLLKRGLNDEISNSHLDGIYALALEAGAIGGKLLGAGGGGHFLFCVPQKHQESVKEALDGLAVQVPFKFESKGTRLVESSDG